MDEDVASDFVALWQSELTAMAADRELRETWAALVALWATAATARLAPRSLDERPPGGAGAIEPARPAAAAAASEPGLAQVEQLNRRIDELERRLAGFIGGANSPA